MNGPAYIEEGPQDWDEEGIEEQQVNAIPVHVVATDSERVAPQYASCMTYPIPQAGTANGTLPCYTQILPRRQNRYKAKFQVVLDSGATAVIVNSNEAPLTNPTPQGGTFTILPEWESEQPLYAVAIGGTATISVIDETYGQQQ